VVTAFNRAGKKLKIVGEGPQFVALKKLAAPNIELLGRLSDIEVTKLILGAKALVFPTYEDFGIVPVEAMAAGVPVIAFAQGGALETVVDGRTGVFFAKQTPEAIIEALKKFETMKFDPEDCREQARKFSKNVFKERIKRFVDKVVHESNLV
jgi:glycosyltransferase involved in cell wall biosynthesis